MRKKRILVLGASGMIGQAIQAAARLEPSLEILPASHRDKPGHIRVDFASLTTPESWATILHHHEVDAVVNCVGIWSGTAAEFELVQYTVPVALFDACAASSLRVVHISALGFSEDSPLPYASTKARADRYLLAHCPTGTVIYPSLVFGNQGNSSRFFLSLAALPVQVDFGLPRNLQPVHEREVAIAVVRALTGSSEQVVECAGTHQVAVSEYLAALRVGMGLRPAWLTLRIPRSWSAWLFRVGELLHSHFVNNQTWVLLQTGTHSERNNEAALPYTQFATAQDRQMVQETQLYWFARLSVAFIWLWTAVVTAFGWPRDETLSWLSSFWPGLGTPSWLFASCALDATMGVLSLFRPSSRLWKAQLVLTVAYSVGLAVALPTFWLHPFGPLTKNLAVLAAMFYLLLHEDKRAR